MFADIFIQFILNKNLITEKQAKEALLKKISKVRPAVIAVYEKLMTQEQAERITALQKSEDMPFEFLVTKEGILTSEQAMSLMGRQTVEDMRIMQVLSDKGFMPMNTVLDSLDALKKHYSLTDEMYEGLVNDKTEYFVSCIAGIPASDSLFFAFISVLLKTFMRCVTPSFRIEKSYTTNCIDEKYIITVDCSGDSNAMIGIAFDGDVSVLNYCGRFYKHRMRFFNEDTEDCAKEILNMGAGMFIAKAERDLNMDIDIEVPKLLINEQLVCDKVISAVDAFSYDGKFTMFMTNN